MKRSKYIQQAVEEIYDSRDNRRTKMTKNHIAPSLLSFEQKEIQFAETKEEIIVHPSRGCRVLRSSQDQDKQDLTTITRPNVRVASIVAIRGNGY